MSEKYKLVFKDSNKVDTTDLVIPNKMDWGDFIWNYNSRVKVFGYTEGVEEFIKEYNKNNSDVGLNFVIVNYPKLGEIIFGYSGVAYEIQGWSDIDEVVRTGKPVGSDVYYIRDVLETANTWKYLRNEKDIKDYLDKKGLSNEEIGLYTTILLKAFSEMKNLKCPRIKVSFRENEDKDYAEGYDEEFTDSNKKIKDHYGDGELQKERDGEQDDKYVVIEGSRNGYGIDQVENNTMTVGELIDYLSQFDSSTKVVIGNDFRRGGYYTYGSINYDSLATMEITEPEEYEEEDEDEDEE